MKIKRNKRLERQALDKIKEHLSRAPRSTDKWHVSDLLYPRKAYWGRVDPQPMTDLQALYFTAGRAHHGVLEACLGKYDKKKQDSTRADDGEFEKFGVYYSPDLRMPFPWEIKTSRAEYEPKDITKGYEAYLKQLHKYQACMGQEKGVLLVLYLGIRHGYRKIPALRLFQVQLTKAELAAEVKNIKRIAASLTKAVTDKDHSKLELCPDWMCKNECPWLEKCKPWLQDPKRESYREVVIK